MYEGKDLEAVQRLIKERFDKRFRFTKDLGLENEKSYNSIMEYIIKNPSQLFE